MYRGRHLLRNLANVRVSQLVRISLVVRNQRMVQTFVVIHLIRSAQLLINSSDPLRHGNRAQNCSRINVILLFTLFRTQLQLLVSHIFGRIFVHQQRFVLTFTGTDAIPLSIPVANFSFCVNATVHRCARHLQQHTALTERTMYQWKWKWKEKEKERKKKYGII